MKLPDTVVRLMELLESFGGECWLVGGGVRDSLLGKAAEDWDVAMGMEPELLMKGLREKGVRTEATGIAHGTVTVIWEGKGYEVTAFRTEGAYSDGRRPDYVAFTGDILSDLSRRDFTVNAMAYHENRGLLDPYGGQKDLENGIIRAVGIPEKRFKEDGLRVLRGLRFASVLGFEVEEETSKALKECKSMLKYVSKERINNEFFKYIVGQKAASLTGEYDEVIFEIFPELRPMKGFSQCTHFHHLEVWDHTLSALSHTPPDLAVRLAVLFHDSGKPDSFTKDTKGCGHFKGHAAVSARLTEKFLNEIRCPRVLKEQVTELVAHHQDPLEKCKSEVRESLRKYGIEQFKRLMTVRRADACAKHPNHVKETLEKIACVDEMLGEVLRDGDCFSIKSLAVNGGDLLKIGYNPGPEVGAVLEWLLNEVIKGSLPNNVDRLLKEALAKLSN